MKESASAMSNPAGGGQAKRLRRNTLLKSMEVDCTDLSNVRQCQGCGVFGCTACEIEELHSFASIEGANTNLELRMSNRRKCGEVLVSNDLPSTNSEESRAATQATVEGAAKYSTHDEGITVAEVSAAAFLAAYREALVQHTATFHSVPPKYLSTIDPKHARILKLLGSREIDQDRSPLHEAVRRGDAVTAQILITAGACTESEDMHGLRPLQYAVDDKCRCVLEHHAAVLAVLDANPPNFLIATLVAHCTALSDTPGIMPETPISLSAFDYDAFFLWARPSVRAAVFEWARDAHIAQLAATYQTFADLPDDCAGDVLEFLSIAMTRRESAYIVTHCSSSKARAWVRSIVVSSIGIRVNVKLMSGVKSRDFRTVQDCLLKGAFVDFFDDDGNTALLVATDNFDIDIFTILLHAGANVNAVGYNKITFIAERYKYVFFSSRLFLNGLS